MSKIPVVYDSPVQPDEQTALEAKREMFLRAYGPQALFWTAVEDSQGRRYLRVYPYSDREICLGQFHPDDVKTIDGTLMRRDIAGDKYQCRELP